MLATIALALCVLAGDKIYDALIPEARANAFTWVCGRIDHREDAFQRQLNQLNALQVACERCRRKKYLYLFRFLENKIHKKQLMPLDKCLGACYIIYIIRRHNENYQILFRSYMLFILCYFCSWLFWRSFTLIHAAANHRHRNTFTWFRY